MSRAVLNLKPDALCVRDGLCHRREGQGFQIGRGQTVAVNRNPVRSAPSEAVVLAGDDDPLSQYIFPKLDPVGFHLLPSVRLRDGGRNWLKSSLQDDYRKAPWSASIPSEQGEDMYQSYQYCTDI